MPYYVVTRKSNEITVQFHHYEERASAVEGATAFAQRNQLNPEDVIVVKADTDTHAMRVARTNFDRR